jgi:hypothetical protein
VIFGRRSDRFTVHPPLRRRDLLKVYPVAKANIYIRDNTSVVIGPTQSGELSSRIAACLNRYERFCKELMPTFSRNEWCAIFDANNGTDVFNAETNTPPMIVWANLADSRGMDEKWEINSASVVKRLQKLSVPELLAVQEASVRFWMMSDLDTDDALNQSWARVS